MRSLSCAIAALATACLCAAAYADNTILFTRPLNGVYNGVSMSSGAALFTVRDNGSELQQLTPLTANSYYVASGAAGISQYPSRGTAYWLTRNFSPSGHRIQYFAGQTSDPTGNGPYSGKYYVMDLRTGISQPLFPGNDDNAAPGYGYPAWGPAGSNEIAYANTANEIQTNQPCVYLMRGDGSGKHLLWCAPAEETTQQVPNQAVSSLRWSGNGQKLMAYVSYKPIPLTLPRMTAADDDPRGGTGYVALYVIDVPTGTAVEVAPNLSDPTGGDISYDGSKVLYQQFGGCGVTNPRGADFAVCVTDMTTGNVTTLLPTADTTDIVSGYFAQSRYWYPVQLLSPDGSQALIGETAQLPTGGYETDLYLLSTDGTSSRQITQPDPNTTIDSNTEVVWIPVAWSPDGKKILVNRAIDTTTDYTTGSEIHILNLDTGNNRFITQGYAIDWSKQASQ